MNDSVRTSRFDYTTLQTVISSDSKMCLSFSVELSCICVTITMISKVGFNNHYCYWKRQIVVDCVDTVWILAFDWMRSYYSIAINSSHSNCSTESANSIIVGRSSDVESFFSFYSWNALFCLSYLHVRQINLKHKIYMQMKCACLFVLECAGMHFMHESPRRLIMVAHI